MRGRIGEALQIALLAVAFSGSHAVADHGAVLPLTDCRLENPHGSGSIAARCAMLRVPENRDVPGSTAIGLHVAVVPALSVRAEPDPVVILAGGPGQAASDFYLSLSPAFARMRRERDIVLLDQRGTGRSNRLECEYPEDPDLAALEEEQLRAATQRCLTGLPGDPRYYTTSVAVRDLDEVRAALGYEKLNLYGVSYGTRVAQHYVRRYPSRVRTAILDGAVPVDLALGPQIATDAQRALDALFARCAGTSVCGERFPDLAGAFARLRARLRERPASVRLADPLTGEPTTTEFGLPHMGAAVRLLSYSDETASLLPLLIHEAHRSGDLQNLAAQYLMIQRSAGEQIAYGMHFAVICSEDAPRWTNTQTDAVEDTYLGVAFMDQLRTICALWPRGVVDEDFGAPLASDLPALVLSGGNDPVTPRAYGERVLQSFANGRHLVLQGQGHGQLAIGCMPRLAAQFVASGSAAGLDVQCVANVTPAAFMLSRSAPAP